MESEYAQYYPPVTPHLNVFGLEIKTTPSTGRGVYASRHIPRGNSDRNITSPLIFSRGVPGPWKAHETGYLHFPMEVGKWRKSLGSCAWTGYVFLCANLDDIVVYAPQDHFSTIPRCRIYPLLWIMMQCRSAIRPHSH